MSWDGQGFGGPDQNFPDPKELFDKFKEPFKKLAGGVLSLVILVILGFWAATGFYIVGPNEMGVVKRFGEFVYTTEPGPHWHLPMPIETVLKPKVTEVKRLEIGFRTIDAGPPARYKSFPREALMLTGDENIISCEFIVQYQIKNPQDYLFNVYDPEGFVRDAAEAAMREVVGGNLIDAVLTEAKSKIQIEARDLMQLILDDAKTGVVVHNVKLQDVIPPAQVIAAFRDVASAREDKETLKNHAEAYANDIVPKARGEAEKRLNEAEAYRETVIKSAQGDAARFLKLYAEYKGARDITRKRLYLETMADVMSNARIVLSDGKKSGILPLLSIDRLIGEKE